MNNTTYEVNVTPALTGLYVTYDVSIYRMVQGGVCEPSDEATIDMTHLHRSATETDIDIQLKAWGFHRTTPFGEVCTNGFATATIVKAES